MPSPGWYFLVAVGVLYITQAMNRIEVFAIYKTDSSMHIPLYDVLTGCEVTGLRSPDAKECLFTQRGRRSTRAAVVGAWAVAKLLRNTDVIAKISDEYITIHEKRGTYEEMIKDFYSLKPKNVHIIREPGGQVAKRGIVGDRRITVRKNENMLYKINRPIMEIVHLHPKGDHFLDTIRYVDKKKDK